MALDDFIESEVAVAVAITAAVLSPQVRGVLRRGAVLGLAGALTAGDALAAVARGVARGVQQSTTPTPPAGAVSVTAATPAAGATEELGGAPEDVARPPPRPRRRQEAPEDGGDA